ncbi:MAG: hypothetical protein KAW82_05915 [Desulfurellaceae bacterium]|nr:hypothetical protein [Desulfurellaceae bacterium]
MQTTKQKVDVDILPEEAKKELIDFYELLIKKYKQKISYKTVKDVEKEILADQIQIDTKKWKFKREEIYER